MADSDADDRLERAGVSVWWTDREHGARLRDRLQRHDLGQLADLAAWVAEVQGSAAVRPFARPRLVVLDDTPTAAAVAGAEQAGVAVLPLAAGQDVDAALCTGLDWVDAEVESGTDLMVLACPGRRIEAAAVVSTLAAVEPVRLLERGRSALDATAWMARATAVRDLRAVINPRRGRAYPLLTALADPVLALAVAVLTGAAARRTPVLLDGPLVHAAALVASLGRPAATAWWRPADSSNDPVVTHAQDKLRLTPVLALLTGAGDGTAGLLALSVLRAAIGQCNPSEAGDSDG